MALVLLERHDFMKEKVPIYYKLNLTVEEAAEYSNIGINRISTMLNEISCPFILRVGNKRLVKRKEFANKI